MLLPGVVIRFACAATRLGRFRLGCRRRSAVSPKVRTRARWRHSNKPKRWIVGRYFGKFNKFRNDHWVFGDRDTGAYLVKFSWTAIERHVPVKGAASPDDPALAAYWAKRREKIKPPLDKYSLRLLTAQYGLCPLWGTTCSAPISRPSLPAVGDVVAERHPQGDSRQLPHPSRAAQHAAR